MNLKNFTARKKLSVEKSRAPTPGTDLEKQNKPDSRQFTCAVHFFKYTYCRKGKQNNLKTISDTLLYWWYMMYIVFSFICREKQRAKVR
jgi:hypothetical protein